MDEKNNHFTKNIRLARPQDVRRMLSKVINILLQDGDMSTDKAKTIATLSNTILKSMEMGELEERIQTIEKMLKEKDVEI